MLKYNERFKQYIRNRMGHDLGNSVLLLEYIGSFIEKEDIKIIEEFYYTQFDDSVYEITRYK